MSADVRFPARAQVTATLRRKDGSPECARYPALIYPGAKGDYVLQDVGPPGVYVVDVHAQTTPRQYVNGSFVWHTYPPDDVSFRATIHQQESRSPAARRLDLILSGADVDRNVSATITVTARDGTAHTFSMAVADDGCAHDRWVSLSPTGTRWRSDLAHLGSPPYRYTASMNIGGSTIETRGPQGGTPASSVAGPAENVPLNVSSLPPGGG